MMFTNRTYDVLKWVTQVLLPAIGTLYLALAKIWSLPYADQVAGTIMAVVLFLGVVLQISTAQYNVMLANSTPPMPKSEYGFPPVGTYEITDDMLRRRMNMCSEEKKKEEPESK